MKDAVIEDPLGQHRDEHEGVLEFARIDHDLLALGRSNGVLEGHWYATALAASALLAWTFEGEAQLPPRTIA